MEIIYRDTHELTPADLEELFLSVEWSSGHYPDKLSAAMRNYETVFTAWDGDSLVGLICAMDDGVMTAYVQYMLVRPEYQGRGIGRELMERTKTVYRDYLRFALISYNDRTGFYESCGFTRSEEASPMMITKLWT